eukprot:COSAG01_NODE_3489_length_6015_cov_4.244422_8_plen_331_part_00
MGCAIVWYNQAAVHELLPDTPEDMPWLKLCADNYTDICTPHADTLTASGQLSFVNDFDMLFKTNDSNTNGTSHDLSAAVASRGAQIANLHSIAPAPSTHELEPAANTVPAATPGNPPLAEENAMASVGENAILEQLAALKRQVAGFSTAVSPVAPTATTPNPALLAELHALQQQLNESTRLAETRAAAAEAAHEENLEVARILPPTVVAVVGLEMHVQVATRGREAVLLSYCVSGLAVQSGQQRGRVVTAVVDLRRHTSYATLHTYADRHTSYAVLHTSTSNFILHLSYTIRVLPYCCCCCDDGSSIVGRRTAVQLYEWMAHVLAAGKVY